MVCDTCYRNHNLGEYKEDAGKMKQANSEQIKLFKMVAITAFFFMCASMATHIIVTITTFMDALRSFLGLVTSIIIFILGILFLILTIDYVRKNDKMIFEDVEVKDGKL